MMSTYAQEIEEIADGPIIGCVIGKIDYGGRAAHLDGNAIAFRVVNWPTARKALDYEYDAGYGGADCQPIYAWTETRVILCHEYDGSTGVLWVPRNPTDIEPQFGGQW